MSKEREEEPGCGLEDVGWMFLAIPGIGLPALSGTLPPPPSSGWKLVTVEMDARRCETAALRFLHLLLTPILFLLLFLLSSSSSSPTPSLEPRALVVVVVRRRRSSSAKPYSSRLSAKKQLEQACHEPAGCSQRTLAPGGGFGSPS